MSDKYTLNSSCPSCGAFLRYDAASGKLKCDYCGNTFTAEEIDGIFKKKADPSSPEPFKDESAREAEKIRTHETGMSGTECLKTDSVRKPDKDRIWDLDKDTVRSYICSSCGAELMTDAVTAVMRCPFCGNHAIAASQFSGSIRPDYIIPFQVDKDEMMEKYREYYSRALVPAKFRENGELKEIQGVYVPFWLFSGRVSINGDYKVKKVDLLGFSKISRIKRRGNITFFSVPADASKRMPDDLMDSIEPFKIDGLVEFSMAYLPGYLAERFDVESAQDYDRVTGRIKNSASEKMKQAIKNEGVKTVKKKIREDIDVFCDKVDYVLLPVWMFTVRWHGKDWTFALNGQTGKMTGNLPVSPWKMAVTMCAVFAVSYPIDYLAALYKGFITEDDNFMIPLIFCSIFWCILFFVELLFYMNPVDKASDAEDYMPETMEISEGEEADGK